MAEGVGHLSSIIAAHLREWASEAPYVELAIFETDDPSSIAQAISACCEHYLGAPVAQGLFYQSSVGSVTGVELSDGQRVVIKAHQPDQTVDRLGEIARVQSHLAAHGVFAPEILVGPAPLVHGHAIAEKYVDVGVTADAHRPEIRRALAEGMCTITAICQPLVYSTILQPGLLASAQTSLWPIPHSKIFDFSATSRGAEWIDAIAGLARERMAPAGALVIGHCDWRQEHVRFVAERPVAAFDWDSLCCELEPALIGAVAHGFCADWSQIQHTQAPTLEEARAFVADYETARGCSFSKAERQLCTAAFAYACAYTSRCGHALGKDERGQPGTFQHLLWTERENLLNL
jgi:hypothetical protein